MIDQEEQYLEAWDEASSCSSAESRKMSLPEVIITLCGVAVVLFAWLGFCGWLAMEFRDQLLDPNVAAHGYGRLAVYLRDKFGVWPTVAMLFCAMQIPFLGAGLQVWIKQRREAAETADLPPSEPWVPRLSDESAKKVLGALAWLFVGAAVGLLFNLLPTGLCAIVLVAAPILGIALKVHQGMSESVYE